LSPTNGSNICDGAHWAFVMKKSKAPPKRSLDGPPAKAAMARRLAIQMFWMWRKGWDYEQVRKLVRTRESPEQAMV